MLRSSKRGTLDLLVSMFGAQQEVIFLSEVQRCFASALHDNVVMMRCVVPPSAALRLHSSFGARVKLTDAESYYKMVNPLPSSTSHAISTMNEPLLLTIGETTPPFEILITLVA